MSIKLATVVLLPVWVALLLAEIWPHRDLGLLLRRYWPLAASVLLFVPLLTPRSQQFHPWYWTWVVSWVPLLSLPATTTSIKSAWGRWLDSLAMDCILIWRSFITLASFVLLFRYGPYLFNGNYTPAVMAQQLQITWFGLGICFVIGLGWWISHRNRYTQ